MRTNILKVALLLAGAFAFAQASQAQGIFFVMTGPPICNPYGCNTYVAGAAGGFYTTISTGTAPGCFIYTPSTGGTVDLNETEPYVWASVWANCTTYNPTLTTNVTQQSYNYIDDAYEYVEAQGLDDTGLVTGVPWWSPVSAYTQLYKMFTESDCYEDDTREVVPDGHIC